MEQRSKIYLFSRSFNDFKWCTKYLRVFVVIENESVVVDGCLYFCVLVILWSGQNSLMHADRLKTLEYGVMTEHYNSVMTIHCATTQLRIRQRTSSNIFEQRQMALSDNFGFKIIFHFVKK